MARHQAVSHRIVHETPRSFKLAGVQVGTFRLDISHPFILDLMTPAGRKQPRCGQANESISQGRRIEERKRRK